MCVPVPAALCTRVRSNGKKFACPLPNLHTFQLHQVHFQQRCDYPDFTYALRDCLMLRYEYGVEIGSLEVKECIKVDEGDIDLREIVVSASWDGIIVAQDLEDENLGDVDKFR